MPFRALDDGRIVTPTQVDDQQPVECPECRGILYPRDGDYRARHFFHAADDADEACSKASQGESDTHARCTALAVATLADQYPNAARVGAEITIDATGTPTTPKTRRADALVEFDEENPFEAASSSRFNTSTTARTSKEPPTITFQRGTQSRG
ncbi:hypothetical protein [Haloarcula mannanilytica]|uniref:hypothetical protein n=1 Tax=Haloarcula mannanilytica TaxID=2509225 RepID=UPI001F33EA93|nr:hypothetical protein [Haloarcula mannanilytica]